MQPAYRTLGVVSIVFLAGCLAGAPSSEATESTAQEPAWREASRLFVLGSGGSAGLLWLNFTQADEFDFLGTPTVGIAVDAMTLAPDEFLRVTSYSVDGGSMNWTGTVTGIGAQVAAVGLASRGLQTSAIFLIEAFVKAPRMVRIAAWTCTPPEFPDATIPGAWRLNGAAEISFLFATKGNVVSYGVETSGTPNASFVATLNGKTTHGMPRAHHEASSSVFRPAAGVARLTIEWSVGEATSRTSMGTGGASPLSVPAGHYAFSNAAGNSSLRFQVEGSWTQVDLQIAHTTAQVDLGSLGLSIQGRFFPQGFELPSAQAALCWSAVASDPFALDGSCRMDKYRVTESVKDAVEIGWPVGDCRPSCLSHS